MDRKQAIRDYKNAATPIGAFCIRNRTSGKTFVGTSINIPATLNRQRFELDHGSHKNAALQKDWTESGADAFSLETLDVLEPPKEGPYDPSDDLKALEALWRENLAASLYE